LEHSVLLMLIPVIGKLNCNSRLLGSLWDIEKPNEKTFPTPFSNEWGHLYETGLAKTAYNWFNYSTDNIIRDPMFTYKSTYSRESW
jgi:hypothetical protein